MGNDTRVLKEEIAESTKRTIGALDKTVATQQTVGKELAQSISTEIKNLKEGIDAKSGELSTINNTLRSAVSI